MHKSNFRIFKTANQDLFTNNLSRIYREEILIPANTKDNFNFFFNTVSETYTQCFPIITKHATAKRLQNAWPTTAILNLIKYKSNLLRCIN